MKNLDQITTLSIYGAREHNLQDISVQFPKQSLSVITGVSGSGKTSLVFDTIYAEAERRFMESLSSSARVYLEQAPKAEVDRIEGLSPAIALAQTQAAPTARSTVATLTEIYDYARVLFARVGTAWCPNCNTPIRKSSPQSIANALLKCPTATKVQLLGPVAKAQKGDLRRLLAELRAQGFVRARVDGEISLLESVTELAPKSTHDIEVVVDRLQIKPDLGNRLIDSIELALKIGQGRMSALVETPTGADSELYFSNCYACATCQYQSPEVEPRLFSFGGIGACATCKGLGQISSSEAVTEVSGDAESNADPITGPITGPEFVECRACSGTRLREEARLVRIGGVSITDFCALSVGSAAAALNALEIPPECVSIAAPLIEEIAKRLSFLDRLGLGYVGLSRSGPTLSAGETQRIRLAGQLGSGLSGVVYVLDEPSIGLHPRDTERLLESLRGLQAAGNTLLVVEHDPVLIAAADFVCELGPGAGSEGGRVQFLGTPAELANHPTARTAPYLSSTRKYRGAARRSAGKNRLELRGATLNNLQAVDLSIPLHTLVSVTGVSGSGKSTLINEVLYPSLLAAFERTAKGARSVKKARGKGTAHELVGANLLSAVRWVDQKPIGKSPRSTPVSYVEAFSPLRELYAQLPEARARGYDAGRFSFNVRGGRCEHCQGNGKMRVEMHFLPDLFVECSECAGHRYNQDLLEIRYRGFSIADVLEMRVADSYQLFVRVPQLEQKLKALIDVGLGYLALGQSAQTLSGGEAQRVKLAAELGKKSDASTLYLFDEPTTGLHPDDVSRLLGILNRLVDQGNTVVVIEHNLDVIAASDWCIDLGPGAGAEGGRIVVAGTPEQVAAEPKSITGRYLHPMLGV